MTKGFFTVNELADRWAVSTRTVRNRIKDGELKAVKFGNSWRVPTDAVALFESRLFQQSSADIFGFDRSKGEG